MVQLLSLFQNEFRIRQRCRVVHETSNAADWMLYLLLGFVPVCGIAMDYSPERLQAVRNLCPYPVPDHRGKGNDRL